MAKKGKAIGNPDQTQSEAEQGLGGRTIGAPDDPSLLDTYDKHIASRIWRGEERVPLEGHNRADTLRMWPLKDEPRYVQEVVQKSGLLSLVCDPHSVYDRALISAFVERYYPETNGFYFPFGEMSIGPDDVDNILGVRVEGTAMTGTYGFEKSIGHEEAIGLITELLGASQEDAFSQTKRTRTLTFSWLRNTFMGKCRAGDEAAERYTARAYMMYLLGTTVFPNKSGDKIPVYFLQCLTDLGDVSTISWGSGILAHLHRELGAATRFDSKQIAGCVSLLQTWIYEHFPTLGRCVMRANYSESMPRLCKWKPNPSKEDLESCTRMIREQLDDLSVDDVIFDPYATRREHFPLKDISFYMGLMVCFQLAEPYYADRILRQLGRVQGMPVNPIRPRFKRAGESAGTYRCSYKLEEWHWENWRLHLLPESDRTNFVRFHGQCHPHYMEWYKRVAHYRVQNLNQRVRHIHRHNDGAPATGKFRSRLTRILDLMRCRGDGDRPLSPTSRLNAAADLFEKYEREENMEEFGEEVDHHEDEEVEGGRGGGASTSSGRGGGASTSSGRGGGSRRVPPPPLQGPSPSPTPRPRRGKRLRRPPRDE